MKIRSKMAVMVVCALMLVGVGGAVLWREAVSQRLHIPGIPVQASAQSSQNSYIAGRPVSLSISDINMTYTVKAGSYNNEARTWTLDKQHVFWANLSAPVNTSRGTTLLYAHAEPNLFGRLPELDLGAEVRVKTDSGHVFRYKLVGGQVVDPSETEFILERGGAPRLMLQTCAGMWWEKRHLFAFDLVGVSPS